MALFLCTIEKMNTAKLFRFKAGERTAVGTYDSDGNAFDLSQAGIDSITSIIESEDPLETVRAALSHAAKMNGAYTVLCPVERQEVWAAGVTYLRSKTARMEESDFSANAYDLVYDAERPEIFFKSLPEKVVGPDGDVGIRRDGKWNVPEPELVFVVDSRGRLVGFSIGNDMSSRDIEGENLLYLPQAKVYAKSCAIGPCVVIGAGETDVRGWTIGIEIARNGEVVFAGETKISQIKRSFGELVEFLCRAQEFPHGAMLLTGTGVVPPDEFTLASGDEISISISGIGTLKNTVAIV